MPNLDNLRKLLSKRGEQEKLSKAINISSGNISDWFNPNKNALPGASALYKIAEYYNCSVDYLLGRTNNPNIEKDTTKIYRFPVYNQEAAAGVGRLGQDDGYEMKEYIIDNIPDDAIFAMEISGESMYSEKTDYLIRTGSIILVNSKDFDYDLDDKIIIANFKGEVICKRYINKGNYILFQSDNPDYEKENRKSSDDPDCKIIGVVLGVIEDNKFVNVK